MTATAPPLTPGRPSPKPRTPRGWRRPFASGSVILLVAGLAVFLSGPAQTYGVSSFVDPMQAELGISRSLFSTLYSAGTLASAGVLLLVGRQIDRFGSRAILVASAVGFIAALLLMGAVGHAATLLLGFALLRTCGSGVLTLAARTMLAHWFVQRRGRAFSLLGIAGMVSLAAVPPVSERLIDWVGWRDAWRVYAGVMVVVLLPTVALLARDRPPRSRPAAEDAGAPAPAPADEEGITLREAARMPVFWALLGASAVPSLVVTGLAFNQISIFTDRGLRSGLAATTFSVESAAALPSTLLAGWLLDRYSPRYVLVAGQALLAIAMVCLLIADSPALALTYSAIRGASGGMWMVAADVVWPNYFGRRYLGSIRGTAFAVGVFGAALGPIPFGLAYDLLGGYNAAIAGLLVLPVAATLAVMRVQPPASVTAVASAPVHRR